MTSFLDVSQINAAIATDLSAATAAHHVKSWIDCTPSRRRDLLSAISTVVRVHGLPADLVMLSPASLRLAFLTGSAASFGLSDASLKTIQSALRYVLRRLGRIDTEDTPVSSAWATLLEPLSLRERAGVVRLSRFCSSIQVDPEEVTEATLAAFLIWLTERTIAPKPARLVGLTRAAWNKFAQTRPGWPNRRLAAARDVRRYILPADAFLSSFQEDVASFGAQLQANPLNDLFTSANDDVLERVSVAKSAPLKPVRASTAALRMAHARWAASALVASGTPIREITGLVDLVTPLDNAKAILRFIYNHGENKPSAASMHVGEVLLMLAKYHAHLDPPLIATLKAWIKHVKLVYPGMTQKNRATVRAALHPAAEQKLLTLPAALMAKAHALLPTAPREAAGLAQRALALAFLTRLPIRLANLLNLRLDQHLVRTDAKRRTISHLHILRHETKNNREILMPISPDLGVMIQQWVDKFRGVSASPTCPYLFPGYGTGDVPMTPQSMRSGLCRVTHHHAGVKISPHQFRHIAAKRFLQAHPGHYEAVRQLLGHASLATTTRHYAGDEMGVIAERFDQVITARMKFPGTRKKHAIKQGRRKTQPRG